MEFEKIINLYTILVVLLLVAITLVCVCLVVVNKANGNLGVVNGNICLECCTQILQQYC
jgi:hypothetical protein